MKWHRLIRLFYYIPNKIQSKIDPVGYAKRMGVRMQGKVFFYVIPNLGTEPWLITLSDNVHITKNVEFITHDGGVLILRKEVPDLELTKPITVGNDVYIGINTIILPGVNIGNRCIIAAGAVVCDDVPDNSVYGGIPAQYIKSVDEYFEKAKENSLHLGNLSAVKKAKKLKEIYQVNNGK